MAPIWRWSRKGSRGGCLSSPSMLSFVVVESMHHFCRAIFCNWWLYTLGIWVLVSGHSSLLFPFSSFNLRCLGLELIILWLVSVGSRFLGSYVRPHDEMVLWLQDGVHLWYINMFSLIWRMMKESTEREEQIGYGKTRISPTFSPDRLRSRYYPKWKTYSTCTTACLGLPHAWNSEATESTIHLKEEESKEKKHEK